MSKKLTADINSKFSDVKKPTSYIIPEKIMETYKKRKRTQSFSLKEKDQERLENIVSAAQKHSTRKLSSTDILRGLLIIGEKTPPETIIKNINISFLE